LHKAGLDRRLLRLLTRKTHVYLQSCQFLRHIYFDVFGVAFFDESQTVECALHFLGSCFTISAGISGILRPLQHKDISLAE
jgi:hypothetical protein